VRDMDVLTAFAAGLAHNSDESDCLVQLLEQLGRKRFRGARKLHDTVVARKRAASKRLKRCASLIGDHLDCSKGRDTRKWQAEAAADVLRLSGELAQWPKLTTENLHPLLLKVKELRNVLKLSGESSDLVTELGKVKDAIGEWHDWTELSTIAGDVLGDCDHSSVVQQVQETAKEKLAYALQAANQLRQEYFSDARPTGGRKRNSRAGGLK
jgi:CHAD domain-containing protein